MTNVVDFDFSAPSALAILRECAKDDRRVQYSPHALQRMNERKVTNMQVLRCLCRGTITENPHRDIKGDWKCTVSNYDSGQYINVAVVFKQNKNNERAVIITVFLGI